MFEVKPGVPAKTWVHYEPAPKGLPWSLYKNPSVAQRDQMRVPAPWSRESNQFLTERPR